MNAVACDSQENAYSEYVFTSYVSTTCENS